MVLTTSGSSMRRPIRRLILKIVLVELRIIWRLAKSPTNFLTGSTIEGIVLRPSEERITLAVPPSITATQELVVPKSIPMILFDIFF